MSDFALGGAGVVVAGNQVPLVCNLAALCLETCRWSRCVTSQEMFHCPSRWEMNPVKNSDTGLITESPCKAKPWVSSKWHKGPAVAFGFPLGLWGLGSQLRQIPRCPPLQHPGSQHSHQQSPSAMAAGHCDCPHPLPAFLLPSGPGGPGFLELSQNCGHIPSGNHDIFRFT